MDSRPSDETLLLAVAEHDMGAFRTLYERHAGWLAIRLARRCNDRDLVADAIHPVKPAATSAPAAPPQPPERQAAGTGHRPRALAITAALAATVLVALAGLVLTGLERSSLATSDAVGNVGAVAGAIAYAALGALIVRRRGATWWAGSCWLREPLPPSWRPARPTRSSA